MLKTLLTLVALFATVYAAGYGVPATVVALVPPHSGSVGSSYTPYAYSPNYQYSAQQPVAYAYPQSAPVVGHQKQHYQPQQYGIYGSYPHSVSVHQQQPQQQPAVSYPYHPVYHHPSSYGSGSVGVSSPAYSPAYSPSHVVEPFDEHHQWRTISRATFAASPALIVPQNGSSASQLNVPVLGGHSYLYNAAGYHPYSAVYHPYGNVYPYGYSYGNNHGYSYGSNGYPYGNKVVKVVPSTYEAIPAGILYVPSESLRTLCLKNPEDSRCQRNGSNSGSGSQTVSQTAE